MGGENTVVTGSGTVSDPYVVHANLQLILQAQDTTTVSLDLTGSGNVNDAFILTAVATVSVNDLIDVIDPTPPILNDTLLYNGSKWEYGPAASVPAGSIHASGGLSGDGTTGNPIIIKVSEAVDTSITGLYTYIDANGELRAQVPSVGGVTWGSITGKPTTFPPQRPLTADTVVNAFTPDAINVAGIHIFVGPTAPTTAVDNDIWFQTA
jgi:hypothetical protein